jgi:hypothetical protein
VVHLVEDDECPGGQPGQLNRAGGHLLIGGDDAVHVARQGAFPGGPGGVEVQPEAGRCIGPLGLQMLGGRHDDQPTTPGAGQVLAGGGQRKGRLAGAGRGDGQEVVAFGRVELLKRLVLPRPQPYACRHHRDRLG